MLELTLRLVVSLTIVVGLLLVLARFGARRFHGQAGALVRVVHRQPLSRTSSVAVVTVGSRVLVLGTTEHQVSILTELEPEEIDLDVLAEAEALPVAEPRTHRVIDTRELAEIVEARDPLAGSVLSAQTWRQAFQVATQAAGRATSRRAS
ncbi:MAG: flagellar biosynthetic protein FliO [Propionibacteriales bacterium]|jgi:flagellar protein FliO/FliZ|nr:flagellar biosynthetic protein FliO [Propionibacteriales bacterium]